MSDKGIYIEDEFEEFEDSEFNDDFNEDIESYSSLVDFEDDNVNTRYIKPKRIKDLPDKLLKYEHAKVLADEIDLKKGEESLVIVNGSFIFGDFIEAYIINKKIHVKKMTISTLSMSENNVDSLANLLLCGYIEELSLVVSDYFFSHERYGLIPYIYQELDKDNKFQLSVAGTHTKICIFESYDGMFYIMHGSANLRSSGNIEQFAFEENQDKYNFLDDMHQRIADKYYTIKKSLRGKVLWQEMDQVAEKVVEEDKRSEQRGEVKQKREESKLQN